MIVTAASAMLYQRPNVEIRLPLLESSEGGPPMEFDYITPPSEKRPAHTIVGAILAAIAIAAGSAVITHHLDRRSSDIYPEAGACTGKKSFPLPSNGSGRRRN